MQSYVGQLLLIPYNFAPNGWLLCQGQLVAISNFNELYSLIGTTYGGDGVSTFGLPDLRGRTPVCMGQLTGGGNYIVGQTGGAETVTVTLQQYPAHNHAAMATTAGGGTTAPTNAVLAGGRPIYASSPALNATLNASMLGLSPGNSTPHSNLQPYLVMNWAIAWTGFFPSPT
jgi:microcystin-dependent protein